MAHFNQHLAQALHRSHRRSGAHALRQRRHFFRPLDRQLHQLGGHEGQEAIAQVTHDVVGECARIATLLHRQGNNRECAAGVVLDKSFDELVERRDVQRLAATGRHQLQCGDGVAGGSTALTKHRLQRIVGDVDSRIAGQPANVVLHHVHRQQVELQVLGAAANGLADLLRVGGGEYEHHVRRWLFQRLQQRGFGTLGEHVHFVEDVHPMATGGAQRRLVDDVADGFHAVVAGGVELVHVEAGAALDRDARCAFAARLALLRVLAVEHLRQNSRRGRLTRATWPREEVRLALAMVDDRIAQRTNNMLLPLHFTEASWAVAAVERLRGHRCDSTQGVRHRGAEVATATANHARWTSSRAAGG